LQESQIPIRIPQPQEQTDALVSIYEIQKGFAASGFESAA